MPESPIRKLAPLAYEASIEGTENYSREDIRRSIFILEKALAEYNR